MKNGDVKMLDIKTPVNKQGFPILAVKGKKLIYAPVMGAGVKPSKIEKNGEKAGFE